MTYPDKRDLQRLKVLLGGIAFIFAVAAAILIIFSSSAATASGSSPALAISLTPGLNSGILGPHEERWFKFTPGQAGQTRQLEKSLTLFFTPSEKPHLVSFQLFEPHQIDPLPQEERENFGAGQFVSRDQNPETGELFWTGWLWGEDSYYIQLKNDHSIPIDYWLFTDNIITYSLGQEEIDNSLFVSSTGIPEDGSVPQHALPLQEDQSRGYLNPGESIWYYFSAADSTEGHFEELAVTLSTIPKLEQATFEIFTAQEIQAWLAGRKPQLNNIGAGSLSPSGQGGERFWTGWLIEGGLYYIQIRNEAPSPIDYGLLIQK